jgi:hypothetical protein
MPGEDGMERLVLVYAAPVPIGHHVEIQWYGVPKAGLFGGGRRDERPAEPVVTDLDTGVRYMTDFAVRTGGIKRPNEPLELDPERLLGEPVRTLRGVVRSCRVVTVRSFSEVDLQTHLSVELA